MKELLPFSCKELHTLYAVKEEIGRGGFGVVYAAKRKSDGVEVAIKEVSKDVDTLTEDNVPLEVALMQRVNDVPGVIKLITYFDTSDNFYVVMERFNSKDLFDFITSRVVKKTRKLRCSEVHLTRTLELRCSEVHLMHEDCEVQ